MRSLRVTVLLASLVCAAGAVAAPAAMAIDEIAYRCDLDICLLDPANPSAVTNLTDNGATSLDEAPIWSPDGSKVAFVSNFTKSGLSQWNVFVMQASGTGNEINVATQVTPYTFPGSKQLVKISDLAWSPDGSRIAYTRGNNAGADAVELVNADGTSVYPLPIGGPGSNRHPSWSPDSSKIAYATTKNGPEQIYVVSSGGGIGPSLANGVGHEPNWSPDGSQISFDGYQKSNFGPVDLHVVNVDGSGTPLIVTPGNNTEWTFSAWSPDSQRIAYRANTGVPTLYRVMNRNGTGDHPVAVPGEGDPRHVSWSPDGSRLAYEFAPLSALTTENLYVANSDGSGGVQPLTSDGKSYEPSWRVVLSTPQAPPPHPGAQKPKVVWITKRIPWQPGPPPYVAAVFCNAPTCNFSGTGSSRASRAAGLTIRPWARSASAKPKGGKKPKWVVVGRGHLKLKEGETGKLPLKLNKTGVAAIKKRGKLTIKVTIATKVPGRAKPFKQSHTVHFFLKKTKKKH